MDDPRGHVLASLIDDRLDLTQALRIAIGIASSLGRLHAGGLIHRDLKPASILVDRERGGAWLSGFGLASRARTARRPEPESPGIIAGTLSYMAPEQTGRLNRSIDARSDLYTFGAVLYHLLVGELPFTTADPGELVHCHIARLPLPPSERSAAVPTAVSAIVMKLLAKAAEDRYQTAAGVEADLRRCLAEWEAHGSIQPFTLTRDVSDQWRIPEKLYGREQETRVCLAAFDRVVTEQRPELLLVSGPAGAGKSSVVNELQKALVPRGVFFASGKFDQYNRDVPYASLAQAFQRLVAITLSEPTEKLARSRDAIVAAVGPYGELLTGLVPDLERVIGRQPAAPELAPKDVATRVRTGRASVRRVFARQEHPLVLFLDDLQWLDAATLEMTQHLLQQNEVRHLLLVGAYRDNEVGPEHPLAVMLSAARAAGAAVSELELRPLALDVVTALVADTLQRGDVTTLATAVHEKTAGNPFFTVQFLTALADGGLVAFDRHASQWTWDVPRIAARSFTDNVLALVIEKITRLPTTAREVIETMACLGNAATGTTLASVLGVTVPDVDVALMDAADAGLVTRRGDTYAFLHDRIHEAAYTLIPELERPRVHLRIGRRLAGDTPAGMLDGMVFEIVNQTNRGSHLISNREELDRFAELNLIAGKRAQAAAAHATALGLFAAGEALLGEDRWEHRIASRSNSPSNARSPSS